MKKEIKPKVKLLSIHEASQTIEGFTPFHLRKLCQNGEIASVIIGTKYLIDEKSLLNYVENLFHGTEEVKPEGNLDTKGLGEEEGRTGLESLICPHCDQIHDELDCDLWKLPEEGEYICLNCGKTVKYSKSYMAFYHSEVISDTCTEERSTNSIPKIKGGIQCKMKSTKKP